MARISRSQAAIYLDQDAVKAVSQELNDMFEKISDWNTRTNILKDAGAILLEEAQRLTPVGKPRQRDNSITRYFPPKKLRPDVKYTYDTPKLNKNRRAGKGYGRVSGKYGITNLRHSIVDIAEARKRMRTYKVVIGPIYTRRKNIVNPASGKANGWYAHMVYGNARAFRERVTGRALQNTSERIYRNIRWDLTTALQKIAAQNDYVKGR